jgi:hypothetical protein
MMILKCKEKLEKAKKEKEKKNIKP